ncbi:hypothetical protein E3U55_15355 [Filobacillus milosensis]|uniref:DUF2157 domain-containing protein n=1 Tax=Filobacillus milosensis TaxID=94137 RepID=A0A4Y8IJM2_9BACI|nr:hypothetical protein [Filobacillus milosensis]TFB13779.1 hypothetical protein E3U55_15355 [Filobacillus milosensis]
MEQENRKKIFSEELNKLRAKDYINYESYESIKSRYLQMCADEEAEKRMNDEQEQKIVQTPEEPNEPKEKTETPQPVKKVKKKKKLSPQQVRDRNVTWVLIIGVLLLLTGGMVLATSNWSTMSAMMKTSLVAGVSGLFFLISWLSGHKLQIKQTAFAFLVLGSLFLPIVVLAAGFFGLLGEWLSLYGEGQYLLGLIGSIICLPLYIFHARRQHSRLFVWFSYLTLSLGIGFLIASFHPPIDVFYFGVVLYNACLIAVYYYLKQQKQWPLFLNEMPIFAQGNLILSTILLLFIFDSPALNGFNVLLTAGVYFAMLFVLNRKEYNFVFTLLFVYGIYQLIEHTDLGPAGLIVYALVGFVFFTLQEFQQDTYLKKAFQLTNAFVTFCAFIFISFKGTQLMFDSDSWILFVAYLLIAINYLALTHISTYKFFRVLATFFIVVAGMQPMTWMYDDLSFNTIGFHVFILGTLLFFGGFYFNEWKFTKKIKNTSLVFGYGLITISLLVFYLINHWIELSILLLLTSIILLLSKRVMKAKGNRDLLVLAAPILWFLAGAALYPELVQMFEGYESQFGRPFHLSIVGLVLIGVSVMLSKLKQSQLGNFTFWYGVGSYAIAALLLIIQPVHDGIRTLILLVAIGIAYVAVQRLKDKSTWVIVSLLTLATYISTVDMLVQPSNEWFHILLVSGAALLIVISRLIPKKLHVLQESYFYLAHVYLPLSIIVLDHFSFNFELYVIALVVYVYSIWTRNQIIEKYYYLYASFISVFFIVYSLIREFYFNLEAGPYALWLTSLIVFGLWFITYHNWKARIKWFFIPLSLLSVFAITQSWEMSVQHIFVGATSLIVLSLFVMYRSHWHMLSFLPLLALFDVVEKLQLDGQTLVFVLSGIGVLSALVGYFLYEKLYDPDKKVTITYKVDWYSMVALVFILV